MNNLPVVTLEIFHAKKGYVVSLMWNSTDKGAGVDMESGIPTRSAAEKALRKWRRQLARVPLDARFSPLHAILKASGWVRQSG